MVNISQGESRASYSITRRHSLAIASALASVLLEGCKFHGRDRIIVEFENNTPNCYVAGTQIRTSKGPISIENLRPGDEVCVSEGREKAVRWVAQRRYFRSPHTEWPEGLKPVRIARGALGEDVPNADLYVSQNHRLFLYGMLIRAADLIGGTEITVDSWSGKTTLEYFHLLVEGEHEIVFAQDTESETLLLDARVLRQFDNVTDIKCSMLCQTDGSAKPFAPIYDYGSKGRLAIIRSHLRSAVVSLVDARDDVDRLRDALMARRLGVWRRRA
jgi:hypothetical protein